MQAIVAAIRRYLADPRHQLYAWIGLGAVGVLFAAAGVWMLFGSPGDGDAPAARETPTTTATVSASPTATAARTATPTSTETATPSATPSPSPTATPDGDGGSTSNPGSSGGTSGNPTATPTPTSAASTNLPYCDTISSTAPPTRVFGSLNIDDPGSASIYLAFDGARGPSATITSENQSGNVVYAYRADFGGGGADCANQAGAALSVVVNGTAYATGFTLGDGNPGFIRFDIP